MYSTVGSRQTIANIKTNMHAANAGNIMDALPHETDADHLRKKTVHLQSRARVCATCSPSKYLPNNNATVNFKQDPTSDAARQRIVRRSPPVRL